jgi:UDP:flavonoid glycosyltransferase YjiC (YdhE family)
LPAKKLTAERLAAAIRAVIQEPAMRDRAVELSERIAPEDGAARASEQIEISLGS